jgi:hypothetical protein
MRIGEPLKRSKTVKTKFSFSLSILCVGILLVGPQLLTLANPAKEATASIPFGFYVKDKKMPSGDYKFLESDSFRGVLWVERTANPEAAVTFVYTEIPNEPIKQAKLVFHKYGEQYFLAEIWNPILDEELVMFPSHAEKEAQTTAERDRASAAARPEMVAITLNLGLGSPYKK